MGADWAKVLLDSLSLILALYALLVASRRVARDEMRSRLRDLDETLDLVHQRVTRVEERIAAAPTHSDLAKVYERLDELSTVLHQLAGEFKSVNRQLGIVTEHLMRGNQG